MSPHAQSLCDAMMFVAAEQGWSAVTPFSVAHQAGLPPVVLWAALPTADPVRVGLLRLAAQVTDAAVLRSVRPQIDDTAYDRLFEVMMARLDALAAWKPGLHVVQSALRTDPALMAGLGCVLLRSMGWMLALAGQDQTGWRHLARRTALLDVWRRVVADWLVDDSEDLGKTMAALDQALRRYAGVLNIHPPVAG